MSRTILVPLDGSRAAEAAVPLAREFARRARASLHLFRAHETAPVLAGRGAEPAGEPDGSHEEAYLSQMASRLRGGLALDVTSELAQGSPIEALDASIAEHRPALVVVATGGRGSLDPLRPGSVADHLARRARAPLLLVRPDDSERLAASVPALRRVLAPIDVSERQETLVDGLAEFACMVQAHVTLVHVVTPPRGLTATLPEEPLLARLLSAMSPAERAVPRWLDTLADRLRARGVAAAARVALDRNIGSAILTLGERMKADLVALHAHARDETQEGTMGPVADQVLRGARTPVVILPAIGRGAGSSVGIEEAPWQASSTARG